MTSRCIGSCSTRSRRTPCRTPSIHPRDMSGDSSVRTAGATCARFPRRLQPVAAAVEESTARVVGRPRAEPGAQNDCRARTRDRGVQGPEYWTIEADVSKNDQPFASRLVTYKGDKVEQFSFETEAKMHARDVEKTILSGGERRQSQAQGRQRHEETAPAESGGAVHDVNAAAGGVAQARLQYATHDAHRTALVRRYRATLAKATSA